MAQNYDYGGVEWPDPDEGEQNGPPKPPDFSYEGGWLRKKAPAAPAPVAPEPVYGPPEDYGPPASGGYGEPEGAWEESGGGGSAPTRPEPPAPDYADWVTRRAAAQQPTGGYEPAGAWAEVAGPPSPPSGGVSTPAALRPEFLGVASQPWYEAEQERPQYTGGFVAPPITPYAATSFAPAANAFQQLAPIIPPALASLTPEAWREALSRLPADTARQVGDVLGPPIGSLLGTGARVLQAASETPPGQFIGKVLETANRPFEDYSEPIFARDYLNRPAQYNIGNIVPMARDFLASDPFGRLQAYNAANPSPLAQPGPYDMLAASGPIGQGIKTLKELPELYKHNIGQWQAFMQPLYGTPEEVAKYRKDAPALYQLAAGVVGDPLMLFDPIGDKAFDAMRAINVAQRFAPSEGMVNGVRRILTTEEVAAEAARNFERNQNVVGKLNPFAPTRDMVKEAAVRETTDMTTRIVEAAQAANLSPLDGLKAFIANPDDAAVVAWTGGLSQSRPAKRAATVLREVVGEAKDGAGFNFGNLEKALKDVKADEHGLHAVAELARQYADATDVLFGKSTTSAPAKAKNFLNHWYSAGFMGYNPGYAWRNAANNLVTSLADGVNPFQSPAWERELWSRWGTMPQATLQGIGGRGGESYRNARSAMIMDMNEPMKWRDLVKDVGFKTPTLTLGQNVERRFSQSIMNHHLTNFWQQAWPKTVARYEQKLVQQGIPPEHAALFARKMRAGMNARELRRALDEIVQGVDTSLPDAVTQVVGNDLPLVNKLEKVQRMTTPQGKAAANDVLEVAADETKAAAQAADEVHALAANPPQLPPPLPPTAQRDEVLAYLDQYGAQLQDYFAQLRQIERDFMAEHQANTRKVWQQVRILDYREADVVWQEYWEQTQKNLRTFYDKLNAAEGTVGAQVGFTPAAIKNATAYRDFVVQHREAYIKALQQTWSETRKLAGKDNAAARDALWEAHYAWVDQHFAKKATREDLYATARIREINEAIAKGSRGGTATPPPGAAPKPPVPPAEAAAMPVAPQPKPSAPSAGVTPGHWTKGTKLTAGAPEFGTPGYRQLGENEFQKDGVIRGGWKIHLTVDPSNYAAVDEWLWNNHDGMYKVLSGGEVGEKDFTVYIGSRAKMDALAQRMEAGIGDVLLPSTAGADDAIVGNTGKVAARFDVQYDKKQPYLYYGRNGVPYDETGKLLEAELRRKRTGKGQGRDNIEQLIAEHEARIDKDLRRIYGDYYGGTQAPSAGAVPEPAAADFEAVIKPMEAEAQGGAQRLRFDDPSAKPILDEIDSIVARGRQRREASLDPDIRGLRPADVDWLTSEENDRIFQLQAMVRQKSSGEAAEDVARKRAERLAQGAQPVAPVISQEQKLSTLRAAAQDAGIATAKKTGEPDDFHLTAFAKKYAGVATPPAQWTDADIDAVRARLAERASGKLPTTKQAKQAERGRNPYEPPAVGREYRQDILDIEGRYEPPAVVGAYDIPPYAPPAVGREYQMPDVRTVTPIPPEAPKPVAPAAVKGKTVKPAIVDEPPSQGYWVDRTRQSIDEQIASREYKRGRAGKKFDSITVKIWKDGAPVRNVELVRYPGEDWIANKSTLPMNDTDRIDVLRALEDRGLIARQTPVEAPAAATTTKPTSPQVGTVTKYGNGVSVVGTDLTGDRYLVPGFEEYPIVAVKPHGSKAAHTKQGWAIYDETTGKLLYREPKPTDSPQSALLVAKQMMDGNGKAKWKETIERNVVAPTSPVAPAAATAREPWQMTWKEYQQERLDRLTPSQRAKWEQPERVSGAKNNVENQWGDAHKVAISQAVAEGKPVPASVLADYPDLAPKTAAPTADELDFQRKAKEYEAQRAAHNAEVDEYNRLVDKGRSALPGLTRIGDLESAGRVAELREAGKLTDAEWDAYVADLRRSGKLEAAPTPTPPIAPAAEQAPAPQVASGAEARIAQLEARNREIFNKVTGAPSYESNKLLAEQERNVDEISRLKADVERARVTQQAPETTAIPSPQVAAQATGYGTDAEADYARYKQLHSDLMNFSDPKRLDETQAEMTALAKAYGRDDPFSDYFDGFLKSKTKAGGIESARLAERPTMLPLNAAKPNMGDANLFAPGSRFVGNGNFLLDATQGKKDVVNKLVGKGGTWSDAKVGSFYSDNVAKATTEARVMGFDPDTQHAHLFTADGRHVAVPSGQLVAAKQATDFDTIRITDKNLVVLLKGNTPVAMLTTYEPKAVTQFAAPDFNALPTVAEHFGKRTGGMTIGGLEGVIPPEGAAESVRKKIPGLTHPGLPGANQAFTRAQKEGILAQLDRMPDDLPQATPSLSGGMTSTGGFYDQWIPREQRGYTIKVPDDGEITIYSKDQAANLRQRVSKKNIITDETGSAQVDFLNPVNAWNASADAAKKAVAAMRQHLASPPANLPPLTPQQARIVRSMVEKELIPAMIFEKAKVSDMATGMRDFALGDYAARRNIHEWLSYIMPYSYWFTFTYKNWAQRLLANPQYISNYARVKAMLYDKNEEWFRKQTGDPNAKLPPQYEDQVRVNIGDNEVMMNLERTLNPLNAIVDDFKSRARQEAPLSPLSMKAYNDAKAKGEKPPYWSTGAALEDIGNWGPTVHPLPLFFYALWLDKNGYPDAARQWSSYQTAIDRPVRALTAKAREVIPGMDEIIPKGGAILPSGPLVEGVNKLVDLVGGRPSRNWFEGGDIWDQRQFPRYLIQMLNEGKITPEQMEDAAFTKDMQGAWGDAAQAQAVAKFLPTMASWLLGQGFKPHDVTDVQIDQMNNAQQAIYDQLDKVTPEAYKQLWKDLDAKYPWRDVYMMGRESDPVKRLSSFSWGVLDRLPPGQQRYQALEQAGITDAQIDNFYQSKGKLQEWTPEAQTAWKQGIVALAQQNAIPQGAAAADMQQAQAINTRIRTQALESIAQAGYNVTPAGIAATESGYFEQPEKARAAYLKSHPELAAYWDAKSKAEAGITAAERQAYEQYYPPSPSEQKQRALVQVKGEAFAKQFAQYQQEYYAAGPDGSAARKQYMASNPQKAAILNQGWDAMKSPALTQAMAQAQPNRDTRAQGYAGQGTYAPGAGFTAKPPTTAKPAGTTTGTLPATGTTAGATGIAPNYNADEAIRRYGEGVFSLDAQYSLMSSDQRKQWRAANGEQWTQLARFREYKYGIADEEDAAYGVKPGYSVEVALQRFGQDILSLEAKYGILDDNARKTWRNENGEAYKRLTAFWDYKYGPKAQTTSTSSGAYYGGGGGGRGGGGYAPKPAPVPGTPPPGVGPTPEERMGLITPEQYAAAYDNAATDPGFPSMVRALFGGDILQSAAQWFGMDATARSEWQKKDPAAYARLLRYLLWLMALRLSGGKPPPASSIPKGAPVVPPSAPVSAGRNAPVAPPVPPA